jgi:uncharacterized OsmC-like protein
MEDIVKKLEEASSQVPQPGGQPGTMQIRIRVNPKVLRGQRKRAEVWGETATGARRNSRWQMCCDEGTALGGEDTAPPPLAYFSAGIAFSLLTQISGSGEMMKLTLNDVRVDQTARFYRQGSVLAGTIKSESLGMDVLVDIQSPEPPEPIAELIRVAKSSCCTHGALADPITVGTNIRLNGQAVFRSRSECDAHSTDLRIRSRSRPTTAPAGPLW